MLLSGKFTGNYSLENDEAVIFGKLIITKRRSPGMAILLLAIPILKELSKP
jgi:hypothetical protein